MKRFFLLSLCVAAGCAAPMGSHEDVGSNGQAVVAPPGKGMDPDDARKLPHFRFVPSSTTGTGTGTGGNGGTPSTSPWTRVANVPDTLYAGVALLLTDGRVMVQTAGSADWYALTPDAKGSYANGTWRQLASMPNGYAPLYFASAVLPDGRVIIEGGEYLNLDFAWTNRGAIYDPKTDTWTEIAPPAGWSTIGDAQSVVLPDGRFLLANAFTTDSAVLDPKTLTWTAFGSGKADIYDEEGWTLLQNGKLLTVDANNLTSLAHAELFDPHCGAWTSAGDTPFPLADVNADGSGSHEMGPTLTRPDGSVFAAGANGHTAVYHPNSGKWTAGPDFPNVAGEGQLDVADGPAALLPNGHVLVVASPGVYLGPAHVFDFDGATLTEVAAHPGAAFDSSYNVNLLLLPSGEVLLTDFSNDLEIYPAAAAPHGQRGWAPSLDDTCGLGSIQAGSTHEISGVRLNGLSQGVAYGDDAQASTNYPLVRVTNRASGVVTYGRTYGFSNASIERNNWSRAFFDLPASTPTGDSDLVVVANGIASSPVRTRISAGPR